MSLDTEAGQQESVSAEPYVSLTYRYLRIGMVLTVVAIFVAVAIQFQQSNGTLLGSISAYYYTPAQFVFVASLVAIGVSLIVIRGRDGWEDGLLNLAGMFAIVVAIVPTPLVGDCLAPPVDAADALSAAVHNNLLTYLMVGSTVLAGSTVGVLRARNARKRGVAVAPNRFVALLPSVLIGLGGWYVFLFAWGFVNMCAHPVSAISLFGCIAAVVAINAIGAQSPSLRSIYWTVVAAMLVAGVVIVVGRGAWSEHWVLILEAVEIGLFAAFWIVQTLDPQHRRAPEFDRYRVPPMLKL